MNDLERRLRDIEVYDPPDLWPEIEGREPHALPRVSQERRVLVVVLAFLVASAGIGVAVRAFSGGAAHKQEELGASWANGRIAFASFEGNWQIVTVDPDGTHLTRLTDLPTNQFHPAWSPDGGRIAFDAQESDGRMEIYVMDADGSNLKRLTEGPGWNYLPDWSPDGRKIAFVSNRDGNDEIYVMNADGSGQTRLTDDPEEDLVPDWSADGSRIAFQSNRNANNEIYVMNADGSGVTNLTDAPTSGEFDPAWSPDGGKVAFVSDRDGNPEIYVMNSDGSGVTRLTDDPSHDWSPGWSPDGSMITFESDGDRGHRVAVYVMKADGTGIKPLFDNPHDQCCPAWQSVSTEETSPTPSFTPSPRSLEIAARIPAQPAPVDVASGYGAIWVSGASELSRIDPASDRVVAQIPLPGAEDFSRIAVGERSVWVSADRGVVYRIDPAFNSVVDTIQTPFPDLGAIAVGDGFLWAAGSGGPGELMRLDPDTGQAVGNQIAVGSGPKYALFVAGELWITTDDAIDRVDPATGDVISVAGTHGAGGLAFGAGSIWSTSSNAEIDFVVRIDPATAQVSAAIPVRLASGVAFGDGVVWVHTEPPSTSSSLFLPSREHPGTVLTIDPNTNGLSGGPIEIRGLQPIGMAAEASSAWIADYQDAVVTQVTSSG